MAECSSQSEGANIFAVIDNGLDNKRMTKVQGGDYATQVYVTLARGLCSSDTFEEGCKINQHNLVLTDWLRTI